MPREYDIFLSYAARDSFLARKVSRRLSARSLSVFQWEDSLPRKYSDRVVWDTLAESAALVVVTTKRVEAPNIHAEIGAAAAWEKPIYIVTNRAKHVDVGLRSHHVHYFTLEQLPKLIRSLQAASRPMSTRERLELARIYSHLQIPADQITRSPLALDRLTSQFNRVTGKNVSGTSLVRELLQLRKRGSLPVLGGARKKEQRSLHVVPRQDGWAVADPGKRAISFHQKRDDAIDAARRFAIRGASDVVIHNRAGKIEARDSFGRYPMSPHDRRSSGGAGRGDRKTSHSRRSN